MIALAIMNNTYYYELYEAYGITTMIYLFTLNYDHYDN